MRISLKFRRTIAPFRVLPFVFVATVHDIVQACVCQRILVSTPLDILRIVTVLGRKGLVSGGPRPGAPGAPSYHELFS